MDTYTHRCTTYVIFFTSMTLRGNVDKLGNKQGFAFTHDWTATIKSTYYGRYRHCLAFNTSVSQLCDRCEIAILKYTNCYSHVKQTTALRCLRNFSYFPDGDRAKQWEMSGEWKSGQDKVPVRSMVPNGPMENNAA